jgi:hypothetical protein
VALVVRRSRCGGPPAHFDPSLEHIRSRSTILDSGDVAVVKMEEVADLVMRREETLYL